MRHTARCSFELYSEGKKSEMRNIYIYTGIILLLATAACFALISTADDKVESSKNNSGVSMGERTETAKNNFELETEFKKSGTGLTVAYKITNKSNKNVFLINKVPVQTASGLSYDAENYYLVPDAAGSIQISKQAFFIKAEDPASSAISLLPAAIRLNIGQTFGESFEVHKPFQINHPYKEVANLQPLPDSPKGLRFCVAVVEDNGQTFREKQIGNEKLILLNAATLQKQQILCGAAESTVL